MLILKWNEEAMKWDVLHIQFEFLFHFEMNRCFCVDETQGLVHTTSWQGIPSCLSWVLSAGTGGDEALPSSQLLWPVVSTRFTSSAGLAQGMAGMPLKDLGLWSNMETTATKGRLGISGLRKYIFSFLLFPDLVSFLPYHFFLTCFHRSPEGTIRVGNTTTAVLMF